MKNPCEECKDAVTHNGEFSYCNDYYRHEKSCPDYREYLGYQECLKDMEKCEEDTQKVIDAHMRTYCSWCASGNQCPTLPNVIASHFYAKGLLEAESKKQGTGNGWQGTAQEWREEIISLLQTYRGIETICPKCSGWGVHAYANTSTWRHGIGGQQITNGLCDGCWGSGDANRKWVSPIEIEAKIAAAKREAESKKGEVAREIVEWAEKNLMRGEFGNLEDYCRSKGWLK